MNKEMIKISVIIPVYNVEKFLRHCLDTVLSQTLAEFEAICVNDGSPDNCGKILDEYAQKDTRIKVIHQANQGAGEARNVGIRHSVGDYLFFMDADDYIDGRFLEEMFLAAETQNADIVETSRIYNVYGPDDIRIFTKKKMEGFHGSGNFFRCDVIWDKLFKADVVKRHSMLFPNGSCHNDAFFLLQSLACPITIARIDTAAYYHTQTNAGSIRSSMTEKKRLSQLDMLTLEVDYMNYHDTGFSKGEYKKNYKKIHKTAKRHFRYIAEHRQEYREKLHALQHNNKYPSLLQKLRSSIFKDIV